MVKLADVKVGDKVRVYDGMRNPVGIIKVK